MASYSAHANHLINNSYVYTADEIHPTLTSEVNNLCRKKAPICYHLNSIRVKDKDKSAYTQIKYTSSFDFLYKMDCSNKNRKTVTYLCHMKVIPSLVPTGLKLQASPIEIVEMD